MRLRSLAVFVATLAIHMFSAAPGRAQEPPPARTPPRVLESAPAAAPTGFEDETADVELELVIAPDGTIASARVSTSAGEGREAFDEVALSTIRGFRFEPARIDGQPVAARIRYRFVFEPVPEEPAPSEPEEALPSEAGPEPATSATEVAPAPVQEDEPDVSSGPVFGARATVDPLPREVVQRVITREALTRMPGTRGDALRTVELLPGVGRPAFGGGVLIVRGAAPGDSQVFLDGSPVPLLYHFGGLTSFYNSQLLDSISFVPGNFSVRYGRKIGGILEVDPRDPRTDGYHGFIDISAIDGSIMLEGPIGDRVAFAVAFRRSVIDLVLGVVQQSSDSGPQFLTAPVYYDYQGIATWTPDRDNRVRLLVYGSTDELALLLREPSADFSVRGNLGASTQFHRIQLAWRHLESNWFQQDIQASVGLDFTKFSVGDSLSLSLSLAPINVRSEWRLTFAPSVRVLSGIDLQINPVDLAFRGPSPSQGEGRPSDRSATTIETRTGLLVPVRPGAYFESNFTLIDALDLSLGVRADYFSELDEATVDPRLVARHRVLPWLTLRGGVGVFSQPPEFQESSANFGNANLDPLHALHLGLGTDFKWIENALTVSLDGFYKHIWDRPISTERGQPPRFTNDGIGRIYGLEVGARIEPNSPLPFFGFLSYTFSRSERQDGPNAAWRLFDFDQTHILTLAFVVRLGRGWEAGATFRLVSGNPLTPVVGAFYDVRRGTYLPIYGPVNSERNPFFHRLDVRISKLWQIGDVRLTLSIDVQNVYNQVNREGVVYNYDYSRSADLGGLPIIPAIGLRGEL